MTKIKQLVHFLLKLVDILPFTKGHHQNYFEIHNNIILSNLKTNYQYELV